MDCLFAFGIHLVKFRQKRFLPDQQFNDDFLILFQHGEPLRWLPEVRGRLPRQKTVFKAE